MRIRPATDEDVAAVTALWTEAYTGRGPGGRATPYAPAEFFDAAARGRAFVAEEGDGGEVGIVAAVVFYPPDAPGRAIAWDGEAELGRLAVSERARRGGIGRALAELCTELGRQAGAEAVVLWSRPYQVEAHRLYESIGYRRVPDRDSRDSDGSRLVFLLDLR
jgi:ribosomal protein S18 acetylase RimI-like enzyme